jgi:DNA polymerase-3 subunit alpha
MRRNGFVLLGPDMNRSEAEFTVEQTELGYAVRYALAGIRNVGEKAMDQIVAERSARGEFETLEDLFRRMPPGAMNRRQLESLAGAGAFDGLEPNRAKVLANADMLLAVAETAVRERESGQAALFGGEDHAEPSLRLIETEPWSRAEQMAAERENFGFYFAAHPVEQFRAVASANGARSYASLMESGISGGRQPAVLAALVEGVSKGRTRRGGEFVRADFSDSSGQFTAACFEESLVESFQRWAAEGTCVLLNVELDAPSPEEPPRVTVRGARPLAEVRSAARMLLTLDVHTPEALHELRLALPDGAAGKGEVVVRLCLGENSEPRLRLGRDFELDGELAERLAQIEGLANVSLTTRPGASHLRLVA